MSDERFDVDVGGWDPRDMDPRSPDPRDELPSRAELEWEEAQYWAEQERERERWSW